MSVGYILLLKIYENWCFIDLCFLGFQQNHYNFACLLLWGLHFCNPIEHCALARSSTHMRPLILASPIVKFSLCKESLVRIGEVFHNSSKSSQNILLQYKQKAVENQKFGGENGLFLVFWDQIWPKIGPNKNLNFEYFRKSVKVVKQANISVTYLETSCYNNIKSNRKSTILKKTIWPFFGLLSPNLGQKLVQT